MLRKKLLQAGDKLRRDRDERVSKAIYPSLWRAKLDRQERALVKALTKHDFPPNMSD